MAIQSSQGSDERFYSRVLYVFPRLTDLLYCMNLPSKVESATWFPIKLDHIPSQTQYLVRSSSYPTHPVSYHPMAFLKPTKPNDTIVSYILRSFLLLHLFSHKLEIR